MIRLFVEQVYVLVVVVTASLLVLVHSHPRPDPNIYNGPNYRIPLSYGKQAPGPEIEGNGDGYRRPDQYPPHGGGFRKHDVSLDIEGNAGGYQRPPANPPPTQSPPAGSETTTASRSNSPPFPEQYPGGDPPFGVGGVNDGRQQMNPPHDDQPNGALGALGQINHDSSSSSSSSHRSTSSL